MERADLKSLKDDVYIVRIERNLIKLDARLLQHIPTFANALESGRLQLGRPHDLDFCCQPRVMKDVLHILTKRLSGLDTFQDVQSVQVDTANEVSLLLQQLEVADALGLEDIGNVVAEQIRKLCPNGDDFDAVMRKNRLEQYVPTAKPSSKILCIQSHSFGANREQARVASPVPSPTQSLLRPVPATINGRFAKLSSTSSMTDNTVTETVPEFSDLPAIIQHNSGYKRKICSVIDNSDTFDRTCKKIKPTTNIDLSRAEMSIRSSPPITDSDNIAAFGTAAGLPQTQTSDSPLDEQQSSDIEGENDLAVDIDESEVEEDDFECDEDDLDFDEQDSFQLDEDEVTSDDIDELVLSDPLKFECIASPQQTSRKTVVATPVIADKTSAIIPTISRSPARRVLFPTLTEPKTLVTTQSLLSVKDSAASQSSVKTSKDFSAMTHKAPVSESANLVLSGTIRSNILRFDLKQFFYRGLSTGIPSPFVLMHRDAIEFRNNGKYSSKSTNSTIHYTKIELCQMVKKNEDLWAVQLHLVMSSSPLYLAFKSYKQSLDFVSQLEAFCPHLKLLMVSPTWMKAATEISSARKIISPCYQNIEVDVFDRADSDELPDVDEILSSPRTSSERYGGDEGNARTPSGGKKLFSKEPVYLGAGKFVAMDR